MESPDKKQNGEAENGHSSKNETKQVPVTPKKSSHATENNSTPLTKQDTETPVKSVATAGTPNPGTPLTMPRKSKKRPIENGDDEAENDTKKRKTEVSHESYGRKAGCVLTLGEGDTGQLGLGPDVLERNKPAPVPDQEDIIQVCAGGMHNVILTKDGKVVTFGCNDEGGLGRLTSDDDPESEPGPVELPEKIVMVSAGDSHSAALSVTGQLYLWGTFRDANGAIGLVTPKQIEKKPVKVLEDEVVVKVASGADHMVALTDSGDIYTMGNAEQGQLGRVAECFSYRGGRKGLGLLLTPDRVTCRRRKARFSDVWTGTYTTYAKEKETGHIYTWGLNNYFQIGFSDINNRFVPQIAKSFNPDLNWKAIDGGQHHTLALDGSGKVYSLGRAEYGRLGLGEGIKEMNSPQLIPGLADKKAVNISCGTATSFAVLDSGILMCWGMGTSRQLGDADEEDQWSPVQLTGKQLSERSVISASAGGQHLIILATDSS